MKSQNLPDPLALLESLDSAAIIRRLQAMLAEERALKVLLRALRARECQAEKFRGLRKAGSANA